jgi:hypothetical protein
MWSYISPTVRIRRWFTQPILKKQDNLLHKPSAPSVLHRSGH